MLCRGEAGEFRHVKGREVWTVEAGKVRYGDIGHGRAGEAWRVIVRSVGA